MNPGFVAVDRSRAVDACQSSFGHHPRLHLVQADIRQLPFEPGCFDDAYCLGVLQHTPDPAASLGAVARHVRPGGRVAVDVYPRRPANLVWPESTASRHAALSPSPITRVATR